MTRAVILASLLLLTFLSPTHSTPPEGKAFLKRETARIQNHLRNVEATLRTRKTSHLSPAQRTSRQRNLDTLHRYWKRGVFPRNEDFPGRRIPYFRDAHGTLCAMAYLIAESGSRGFVEQVARTNNNAYVRELASSPILRRWLRENGLTVAEAAWIQPQYGGDSDPYIGGSYIDEGAALGLTAFFGVFAATAIATNTVRPPSPTDGYIRGTYGIVSGVLSGFVGALLMDDSHNRTLGYANMALGGTSVGFGVYNLATAHRRGRHEKVMKTTTLQAREFASFVSPTGGSLRATWRF